YGDFKQLKHCLERYIKANDSILQIGCGNSLLADELYDNGFRNVTSVDIVPDVIKKQRQRNKKRRPNLVFETADVTKGLKYDSSTFNVIIDKGTLDALSSDDSMEKVLKMFGEVDRCLAIGGRYLAISLAQDAIIKAWCQFFTGKFLTRIHQVSTSSQKTDKRPVFILIATKLKDGLKFPEMYEFMFGLDMKTRRLTTVDDLMQVIYAAQQYAYFCYKASLPFLSSELEIQMDDYSKSDGDVYDIILVHKQEEPKVGLPFGVFVVPYGNENGYFYATPAGRQELCKLANFRRMAVVIQRRCFEGSLNKKGKTLDEIKTDLNSVIMDFAPSYLRTSQSMDNVPYLSIGDEEEQISKKILESFESEISGIFDVSETSYSENGYTCRTRYITLRSGCEWLSGFMGMQLVEYYSKIYITYTKPILDIFSAFNLYLVEEAVETEIRVNTTVVELDPMILNAAERWFDFKQDELMQCYVDDGVEFFKKKAANKEQTPQYDVIILDVSGSTSFEGGLTCPPPIFLTEECIGLMKKILRHSGSYDALNNQFTQNCIVK
uniref:Methyltransferase domain-containing protein n=1 Tax=Romanomermis culicivorax TaxID=13658 RepID=A0A915KS23_ROMCU